MTMVLRPKTRLLLLFTLVYILLSAYVTARFIVASNLGDSWRGAQLVDMVQGTAERPYVYRPLVPWVIGWTDRLMPETLRQAAGDTLMSLKESPVFIPFIHKRHNLASAFEQADLMPLRASMLLVITLMLAGYVIALYKLGLVLFPDEWAVALFIPIVGLLAAPALAYPVFYTYDIGVLFLSACCYWALAAGRLRWYYLWFVLAGINKETALFIIIFFALWNFSRMERQRFIRHLSMQFFLLLIIRGTIYHAFADNPGEFLKTDYINWHFTVLLSGYDHGTVMIWLIAAFVLFFGWQQKPAFARCVLWPFIFMLIAYLMFGRPGEYRVFYDILPLFIVLVTHTLVSCTGISKNALFQRYTA